MPIRMLCPNCRQPLTISDHLAGKRINCPKCKNLAEVPAPEGAQVPGPALAPSAAPHAGGMDDLTLNIPGQESTRHEETGGHKRCPGCGRDVPEATVLCTGCGHDFNTGQRRKGFEIQDPDKTRRIMGSIVRNGIVVVLLLIGVAGIYYAYTKGLFNPSAQQEEKKEEEKKDEPRAQPQPKPKPKSKDKKNEKPKENKDTLLVITNNRFSSVTVFLDREKIGEVGYRQTEKLLVPPPPEKESVQISFEAELPPGADLAENMKALMNKGIAFSGTPKQGLHVTIKGPPEDTVPAEGETLSGVLVDLEVIKDAATGQGMISAVKYKDCTLKPVPPQKKLLLKYADGNRKVSWQVQECIVERSGKPVYEPNAVPFESVAVGLKFADGKLDVAE